MMERHQEVLSEEECWDRLGAASMGRLALSVRALPEILPVQFHRDGDRLAVCLGQFEVPVRAIDDVIVAFAADAIDPTSQSGWLVQLLARSSLPGAPVDCGQPGAGQIVHLAPLRITGHRVRLCPFVLPLRWEALEDT